MNNYKKCNQVKRSLSEILNDFNNHNVMVIGDIMVDSYLWGSVTRISPEAPVPIVSCTKRENRLGGAANVAENIRSLGAMPVICSVIGKDEKGEGDDIKYEYDIVVELNEFEAYKKKIRDKGTGYKGSSD